MLLEAIYHCTYIGGDPNQAVFHIGDRVRVDENKMWSSSNLSSKPRPLGSPTVYDMVSIYVPGIGDKLFRMGAFKIINISEEREEKINIIIDDE